MKLIQIKQVVRRLSLGQLRRLDEWLHELILKAEESAQAKQSPSRKQIVEEQIVESKSYRLQGVRCGKEKCKCARGKLHGPYWYSYSRLKDKIRSQYIGKELPRDVERKLLKRK
jgi:hypothetical protein